MMRLSRPTLGALLARYAGLVLECIIFSGPAIFRDAAVFRDAEKAAHHGA